MLRLTVRAKNIHELKTKLNEMVSALTPEAITAATSSAPTETAVEPKAKRTRKTKAETSDASSVEASEETTHVGATTAAPVASDKKIEKGELIAMLQKVTEKGGMPRAREILSRFAVNRISDVPAERYPDFLDECAKALA